MSQTYQVCEVTVTLPSLGTITTDSAGNRIEHGDKCRVHLYAVKPDWRSGTIFEGFNVGAITFTGYTDSPFKRSQKIMVPDGYKLVALRVDDDGVPTSWDGLPVHFTGGFIESPIDELDGIADLPRYKISNDIAIQQKIANALDEAKQRFNGVFGGFPADKKAVVFLADRWVAIEGGYTPDEMRDAVEYIKHRRLTKKFGEALADLSPFTMKGGRVFIRDAFIQPGTIVSAKAGSDTGGHITYNCNMRINVDGADKTIREKVHAVVSSYLTPEATEYTEEMVDELMSLKVPAICDETVLGRLISEKIEQYLRKEVRPGGSIHSAIKR
ncbi:phage tail tip fiber protein [Enterobacter chuandaensis]